MTTRGYDDDIISRIEALEKAVRELGTQPLMPNTSQRGGTYAVFPPSGNQATEYVGAFNTAGGGSAYGHSFYDQNGSTVLGVTNSNAGLIGSVDHAAFTVPTAQNITSATWVTIAEIELSAPPFDAWLFSAAVSVPAATTAQFRMFNALNAGSAMGNVLTKAGAYSGAVVCAFLHPFAVGWGDPRGRDTSCLLQFQCQMTAGAGPVAVWPPRSLRFVSSAEFPTVSASTPLGFNP